ncbi:hypothetical protein J6590_082448, partial [Homalodisca vitripennis]
MLQCGEQSGDVYSVDITAVVRHQTASTAGDDYRGRRRSLWVKDYCSPRHKGVLPPTYFYSRSGTELASKEATSTPPQMYPSQNLALLELSTVLNFLS